MTESQETNPGQRNARGGRGGGNRGGGRGGIRGKRSRGGGRGGNRGGHNVTKSPTARLVPSPLEEESIFSENQTRTGINFSKYEEIPVKCEGQKPPSPVTSLEEAGLCRLVMENVSKVGYTSLTPVQRYSLPIVMDGRDLMACAQTGSGKTAAFLLPIIHNLVSNPKSRSEQQGCHQPRCLIITPTRELAIQIYTEAKKFSFSSQLKSALAYGGVSTGSQLSTLTHGCDILVATPGRLIDFVGQGKVGFHMVKYLVLDEADRMLDMGFMPDVKKIVGDPNMPSKVDRVTLMFSATFPSTIRKVADQFLNNYIFLTVGVVGGACADVTQKFYQVAKRDKKNKLTSLLAELGNSKTLVFIRTKHKTHRLAQQLYREGFACNSIHGDRSQGQRELALAQFKQGVSTILLATAVVARGLDIPEVANVINYDMPGDVEEYVHRIGRTGRVGNNGQAISFWDTDEDVKIQKDLVKILSESGQEVPEWMNLNIIDPKPRNRKGDGGSKVNREDVGGRDGGSKRGTARVKESKTSRDKNENNSKPQVDKAVDEIPTEVIKYESNTKNMNRIVDKKKVDITKSNSNEDNTPKKKRVRNRVKSGKEGLDEGNVDNKLDDDLSSDKVKRKRNRNRGKKDKSEVMTVSEENYENSSSFGRGDTQINEGVRSTGGRGGSGRGNGYGREVSHGWAESRQASLPEMATSGGRSGQMLSRRTASQYEFTREDHYRGKGGGHNQREHGRPHQVREEDTSRGHTRGQGRLQPSTPVADIVGILHQQARGGHKEQWDQRQGGTNRTHTSERQDYRGGGGRISNSNGRAGGGGPPVQINSEVADLASLLELKARLAQEKAGSGRRDGGRIRQETRDLANTTHWPAL